MRRGTGMTKLQSPTTRLALGAALLALASCGAPEEQSPAQEEAVASAEPLSDPSLTEQPATSILRPDVVPAPIVDLPPEPLVVTIGFPDGSGLSEAAERQLESIVQSEALAEDWPVVLRGHSDSAGGDAANLRASRRRAEAVAAWLTMRGVAEERIRIVAFGEQNPLAPNASPDGTPNEAGRARNRRVEVIVSPDGRTKEEAEESTAAEQAAGQSTAAEKAIESLSGADTP
jgi:OOP family OmpA-OmpF porin